jgi:hypothetical protein
MKYTARHIRKFINEGKIDAELWTAHFSQVLVSDVPTCNDCGDYKAKTCEGGKNPVECFLAIIPDSRRSSGNDGDEIPIENERKYYRSSRGNVKSHPTGIQKGYDQSKK